MEVLSYVWDWIVPFFVVLTILVFVHEMGHYWIARRNGVRVETFSIGFGPEIYGWNDKHDTRWKISAVPLGGYVKMFGEHDFEDDEEQPPMTPDEEAVSFHKKRLLQRAAIVAAGPFANFLFAIVLLAGLFGIFGAPAPLAGIGSVQEDSAAAEAGFQAGDLILRIDGEAVTWFEDLRRIVSEHPGTALRFDVLRDKQELVLTATPKPSDVEEDGGTKRTIGLLGVRPDPDQVSYERLDPFAAVGAAVERTFGLISQILTALGQIITGSRNADELGGPLRIAQISGQMAQGGMVNFIFFMAALSINLGLINLLPIPMLDGGHLAFYLIEGVRGKPLDRRYQEYGFRFGLILVFILMIFATWNDLVNLKVLEFFRQLVS
jgi:regulator of sigma E protease